MAEAFPTQAPCILLADDNQDNVALIALFLEGAPYRLETAENGLEAVERYATVSPDLIFMDLEMPHLDGYEATRTIRRQERARGARPIPILALTAHAMDEHRERCRQAGFTDFLVKPVRKTAILAALTRYLGGAAATATDKPAAHAPPDPDPERLRPLLPLFFTSSRETLQNANQALALGDLEEVRVLGHKLKGAARSYGFPDLGQASEEQERAAGDGEAKKAVSALREAEKQLERDRLRMGF